VGLGGWSFHYAGRRFGVEIKVKQRIWVFFQYWDARDWRRVWLAAATPEVSSASPETPSAKLASVVRAGSPHGPVWCAR